MKQNKLHIAYTFLIGIFITILVGLGIAAFYEGPKYPDYPVAGQTEKIIEEKSPAMLEYDKKLNNHEKDMVVYSRNVAFISLALALLILGGSYYANRRSNMFADSLLVGGIGVLFYGTMFGIGAESLKITFLFVAIGLAALVFVGYHRFKTSPVSTPKLKDK